MKALVTGGAGFIGSHLCEVLLEKGYKVIAIDDLSTGRKQNFKTFSNNTNFKFLEGSILDKGFISSLGKVDYIFHLAGKADIVPSIETPDDYFQSNVTGTLNILEFARKNEIKKLVYAASSSCYGIPDKFPTSEDAAIRPEYPYALTKYMGEELVLHWNKVYDLPVVSLRLFNVYGPRSRTTGAYGAVFGVFMAQKLKDKPYTVVGDGMQSRDFTYVTDVAKAFSVAAEAPVTGDVLNVGSGGHYSINHLVELLGGAVTYVPKRPGEPDCTFADISQIRKKLGWSASVSFEEGVREMLARIEDWSDAPLWDAKSIDVETRAWFKYLT